MRLQAIASRALLIAALTAVSARGQTIVSWQGGATNNNWTTISNWDSGALPTGAFDEAANVANGGTVILNSNLGAVSPPDGPPGQLLVTNSSKLDVTGSGAFLTVVPSSSPQVNGSATFTNGGILSMTGPSTSFTATGLSFAGGGVYTPVITGASHGLISIPGTVNLGGGTLKPSFTGSPSAPQSWVLADATNISGAFALDSSNSGLPSGKKLFTSVANGGVNGRQLRLDLKNILVLNVNADTGVASITSPTGASITMTGYGVTSAAGQLNPAGWTTVTSQIGGGWGVGGTPSVNHLDEVGGPIPPGNTTQASLTVSTTPRPIGSPFNPNLPFGSAPDLKFEYVASSGELVQADVQATGLNAVNNLLLTVDPSTGQGRLMNSSKSTIRLRGYSILSSDASLKPTAGNWNSIHDQGAVGVDEANATTSNLSELIPQVANSLTLTSGQSYSLGNLFNPAKEHSLKLEFLYTAPVPGDFNGDGSVNQGDLTVLEGGFGTTYTGADVLVWQRNLGTTSASAAPIIATGLVKYESLAGTAAAALPVPEPASMQLSIAAGILAAMRPRRTQRHVGVRAAP